MIKKKIKLNEYISLQETTETHVDNELVVTNGTVYNFWGKIEEKRSNSTDSGLFAEGRLRDNRIIEITARTRDTEDVKLGGELTFDSIDGTFNVADKFDMEFKHYVTILAEETI